MRWHGTPWMNVHRCEICCTRCCSHSYVVLSICQQGLLTSCDISGRGTTIWSASESETSEFYATKAGASPCGSYFMFRCRVLQWPYDVAESRPNAYTTVTNSAHILPVYLVQYRASLQRHGAPGPAATPAPSSSRPRNGLNIPLLGFYAGVLLCFACWLW